MSYQCYWVEAFPALFLLLTPTALTSSAIGVIAPYQCYWSGVLLLRLLLLLPELLGWRPTPYSYYSSFQCYWGGTSAIGMLAPTLVQIAPPTCAIGVVDFF